MKKQILKLGKVLTKAEQKQINGGKVVPVETFCYRYDPIQGPGCINPYYFVPSTEMCCINL